jgi:hypothetical protein
MSVLAFGTLLATLTLGPMQDPAISQDQTARPTRTIEPPPSLVSYGENFNMDREDFASGHWCGSTYVELVVRYWGSRVSWNRLRRIEILRYKDQYGEASQQELARWNSWLQDLVAPDQYSLTCGGGIGVFVDEQLDPSPDKNVRVWWVEGELWRMPETVEQWSLFDQWNADARADGSPTEPEPQSERMPAS